MKIKERKKERKKEKRGLLLWNEKMSHVLYKEENLEGNKI